MRQRRRRCKVGGPGADRGCDRHHAAALHLLGIGNGDMRHALFIMPAEGRQLVTDAVKRLAKPGNIAMPENGPDAGKGRCAAAIKLFDALRRHPTGQRL